METKKCKKCGCSLPSDSNKKICESCRLRRKKKIKKGFAITGSVLLAVVTLGASVAGIASKTKNKQ